MEWKLSSHNFAQKDTWMVPTNKSDSQICHNYVKRVAIKTRLVDTRKFLNDHMMLEDSLTINVKLFIT